MAKKKKHHEEEHVNHERWLITYADMLTLLMVLFVVLYSMSQTDATKFFALKASLNRAFNVEVMRGAEATSLKGDSGASFISPIMDQPIAQEVRTMTGSPSPDPSMVTSLQDLRQAVAQIPIPLESSGHDNVPITTPLYPSNWELSSARAITVGRYLSEHDGISPTRLAAAGYGEFRPVTSNDSREGRARNRRVDLVILFPHLQAQPPAVAGARPSQREALP